MHLFLAYFYTGPHYLCVEKKNLPQYFILHMTDLLKSEALWNENLFKINWTLIIDIFERLLLIFIKE